MQGHTTTLVDDGGYLTLVIADAVDGGSLCLAGSVTSADLYVVARGLVLPA